MCVKNVLYLGRNKEYEMKLIKFADRVKIETYSGTKNIYMCGMNGVVVDPNVRNGKGKFTGLVKVCREDNYGCYDYYRSDLEILKEKL